MTAILGRMSRRPPVLRQLRSALCALLAIVMGLAPVMSSAAMSHEATHSVQGEVHFHEPAAGHEHSHEHDHADEAPDAGDLLHGLTHAVHACGHVLAILSPGLPVFGVPFVTVRLPDTEAARGDAPRAHPFRPPIV